MFYQESRDLALCKKRKVHLLLNSLCDLRDMEIRKLIQDTNCKSFDELDQKLELILEKYRINGNFVVNYYYPDSKTMELNDCENIQDE